MPTITREEMTRLTPEERLALIAVSSAQRLELERRLDSFDQDRSGGISWEQLKADLARRAP